jgi:hypothetical protein
MASRTVLGQASDITRQFPPPAVSAVFARISSNMSCALRERHFGHPCHDLTARLHRGRKIHGYMGIYLSAAILIPTFYLITDCYLENTGKFLPHRTGVPDR